MRLLKQLQPDAAADTAAVPAAVAMSTRQPVAAYRAEYQGSAAAAVSGETCSPLGVAAHASTAASYKVLLNKAVIL